MASSWSLCSGRDAILVLCAHARSHRPADPIRSTLAQTCREAHGYLGSFPDVIRQASSLVRCASAVADGLSRPTAPELHEVVLPSVAPASSLQQRLQSMVSSGRDRGLPPNPDDVNKLLSGAVTQACSNGCVVCMPRTCDLHASDALGLWPAGCASISPWMEVWRCYQGLKGLGTRIEEATYTELWEAAVKVGTAFTRGSVP